MIDFPQKKPYTRQHKKIKEQELGNSGFFITTRPATRSVTKERQQEEMDQRLENMEQSMKSLSNSHEEFRKSQQTLQYLMTEIYEMLAKTSNGENSRGRNHEYEWENSFKFLWNEDERAKIEKMQSEFIVWKEKSNKKMEEHMRNIESFYTPSPAPASQSLPITPTPQVVIVKRKKRVVEATKIHPLRRCTKPPSSSRRSKHCWSQQRRLSSTMLAMLDRNFHHRSFVVFKPHHQNRS
jgi:galactokinase